MQNAVLLSITLPVHAQTSYYALPLKTTPSLSGNFAEIRGGHLHAGIDLRTGGREGMPVYAAAEGTLARMSYAPSGYGRTLYIDHPNGTTTVYAHLQRFTPELEKYFDEARYRRQKDDADLDVPAGRFTFRKGEQIGWSGNSGSSGGPHLHFEIRETSSQEVLNPVATGAIPVEDTTPPEIFRLYYIRVDTLRGVPVNAKPREVKLRTLAAGRYTSADKEVKVAQNGYFVAEVTDRMGNSHYNFGPYIITQRIDGQPVFTMMRNRFAFADTRYVNSIGHYALNRGTPHELIRLAVQAANKIPLYSDLRNRGALTLRDSLPHTVSVEAWDCDLNNARVEFTVRLAPYTPAEAPEGMPPAYPNRTFSYSCDGASVTIPPGCLYEPIFYAQQCAVPAPVPGALSPVYAFHDADTPLHSHITVGIAANIPVRLRPHAVLAFIGRDGKPSCAGGQWDPASGEVTAKVRDFGKYYVVADTLPPRIAPRFTADPTDAKTLVFTISDDFSGIASYRAEIDGRWALMEHDPKSKTLTHPLDPARFATPGTHAITLTVTDKAANTARWTGSFTIKER